MGFNVIPIAVVSAIFGVVAIICPFLVPKGINKGVTQLCLILTGICGWMFWMLCYLAQMNPLIGPKMSNHTLFLMAREWTHCGFENVGEHGQAECVVT